MNAFLLACQDWYGEAMKQREQNAVLKSDVDVARKKQKERQDMLRCWANVRFCLSGAGGKGGQPDNRDGQQGGHHESRAQPVGRGPETLSHHESTCSSQPKTNPQFWQAFEDKIMKYEALVSAMSSDITKRREEMAEIKAWSHMR